MSFDHYRNDDEWEALVAERRAEPMSYRNAMEEIYSVSLDLRQYATSFGVTGNHHMAIELSGLADRLDIAKGAIADEVLARSNQSGEFAREMSGKLLSAVMAGALHPAPKETT